MNKPQPGDDPQATYERVLKLAEGEEDPEFPEDNAFLNEVDKGYVGLTKPQVQYHYYTEQDNDPRNGENKQGW